LSLNSTGLSSIVSLPAIAKLERLELCDNNLVGEIGSGIHKMYPNLRVLKLSNNKLEKLEDVKGLKNLHKLESLDLSENPLVATIPAEDY